MLSTRTVKPGVALTHDVSCIDMGLEAVILKHIRYKQHSDCIHISERARVRLPNDKRVYVKQLYLKHVLGICARRFDMHMKRTCTAVRGFECMNPAHIILTHSDICLTHMLRTLNASVKSDIMNSGASRAGGDPGVMLQHKAKTCDVGGGGAVAVIPTEETLWQNHDGATEEIVISDEDLPTTMEEETETPTIVDYFCLLPERKFGAITSTRTVNIAS